MLLIKQSKRGWLPLALAAFTGISAAAPHAESAETKCVRWPARGLTASSASFPLQLPPYLFKSAASLASSARHCYDLAFARGGVRASPRGIDACAFARRGGNEGVTRKICRFQARRRQ
jgi:hypothetical protein